jgi:hypothetical protein
VRFGVGGAVEGSLEFSLDEPTASGSIEFKFSCWFEIKAEVGWKDDWWIFEYEAKAGASGRAEAEATLKVFSDEAWVAKASMEFAGLKVKFKAFYSLEGTSKFSEEDGIEGSVGTGTEYESDPIVILKEAKGGPWEVLRVK